VDSTVAVTTPAVVSAAITTTTTTTTIAVPAAAGSEPAAHASHHSVLADARAGAGALADMLGVHKTRVSMPASDAKSVVKTDVPKTRNDRALVAVRVDAMACVYAMTLCRSCWTVIQM
jgi:hypothetical protein